MALITNTALQAIGDKLARYASEAVGDPEFSGSFNAGLEKAANDVLTGAGAISTYVLATGDVDVAADLLPAARDLDETHPSAPDSFLLNIPSVTAMVTALNTHLKRYGGATGLDGYLTTLNTPTPTLRFHGHFKKYLKTLSRGNAFVPTDTTLATLAITGAAAGTYAHVATMDTAYAGAKLVAKNVGAITSSAVITVTGKKLDGTTAALTATLSTHTDAAETDLSDTTKKFIDVTNITISSGGTTGDHIAIVAKTDRSIASA